MLVAVVVMGCFVGQQTWVEVAMGCIRFTAVKLVVAAGASMCWRASLGRGLSAWWLQRGPQQQCGAGRCGVGEACGRCMSYGIDVEGWSLWCAAVSLCGRSVGCSSDGRLFAAV